MNDKISSNVKFSIPSQWLIVLLSALALVLINFDDLAVRITEINYWDEAQYIIRGREWVHGTLPEFSWSPLTSGFFALLYLPFRSQANWLPAAATIGRVIIYLLSFLSLVLIAREIKAIPWPAAVVGLALVYPAMVAMLKFQSDAIFAVVSGFGLWQLLRYRNTLNERSIWYASLFCGLAALTRNDGLILFGVFILIVFLVIKNGELSFKRKLAASMLPFFGLLLSYLLLYAAFTGNFFLGTKERTWVAFTQGQYFIYGKVDSCETAQLECALQQAEDLYGSAEDNKYSVINAILGNPGAYADRLLQMLKKLPGIAYRSYGGQTAFSLVIFAALGVLRLLRRKDKVTLLIFAGWMLYLLVYLLTFYRQGYFYLPFSILYLLGLLGVFELLEYFQEQRQRRIVSFGLVGLTLVGAIADLNPVYLTGGLMLTALWLGRWIGIGFKLEGGSVNKVLTMVLLLAAGIYLHGGYHPLSVEPASPLAEEEAILLLHTEYPQDSLVAAGAPGAVASAQMEFISVTTLSATSPEDLYQSFISEGVQAIYVDHYLSSVLPGQWAMIEPQIGEWYQRLYSSPDGSIQVLSITP
jgi:uncharacterized membrane protein